MNSLEREQLACLESRLEQLEQKMAQARYAVPGARFPRAPFLVGSLLVILALSAASPGTSQDSLEQRVVQLEKLIRAGPGGVAQVRVPFEVLDAAGRAILRVSENRTTGSTSAAEFWRLPDGRGTALMFSKAGQPLVSIGTSSEGSGMVAAFSASGKIGARVDGGVGLGIFDDKELPVAGLTRGQAGYARVAIWRGGVVVAELTSDSSTSGSVNIRSPAGKLLATMTAHPKDPNAGAVSVMNSSGVPVAGLTTGAGGGAVVVTNSSGVGLAQMSVSDGRGLFQVYARTTGGRPVAVMTQATEHDGGLLQISNRGTPVASLTVGNLGAGYLQLNDPSGNPTVEAGTLAEGNGQVRAGPDYQCLPVTLSGPITFVPNCIMGGFKKQK